MVCAQLRSRDGFLVDHTCRSAMLHYRSRLLHTLTTLTFSPMMIFGNVEEKQDIILELFSNFEEDQVIISLLAEFFSSQFSCSFTDIYIIYVDKFIYSRIIQ